MRTVAFSLSPGTHGQVLNAIPAVYAIVVRGSEYDIPPDMLDDIIAQSISTFSSTTSAKSRLGQRDIRNGDDYDDEI